MYKTIYRKDEKDTLTFRKPFDCEGNRRRNERRGQKETDKKRFVNIVVLIRLRKPYYSDFDEIQREFISS